jgi:hypothetical protein
MVALAARFVTMSEHLRKCHAMVRDGPQSWWMDADTKQDVPNYERISDDRVTFHNKGSAAVKASSKTGTFSGRFQ